MLFGVLIVGLEGNEVGTKLHFTAILHEDLATNHDKSGIVFVSPEQLANDHQYQPMLLSGQNA